MVETMQKSDLSLSATFSVIVYFYHLKTGICSVFTVGLSYRLQF